MIPLRSGRGSLAFHAGGLRHPGGFGRERFTAYADVTHVAVGARALRIGTRHGVWPLPRAWFREPQQADGFVRTLYDRIAQEPTGAVQLARMAEIDQLLARRSGSWATRALAIACVAIFALQAWLGPVVHHAGFLNTRLVASGEPWRLVTANLLHFGSVHLALNVLGLLAIGAMVERAIGSARTLFVMGVAALGSTLAGVAMEYDALVGASGVVAGLVGALVFLEYRVPERLPASWRIPRGLLVTALAIDGVLGMIVPIIAGAAHVGGFAAGLVASALCIGPGLRREPLAPSLRVAVALVLAVAGASVLSGARLLAGGRAWEGHASRLLELDDAPVMILNDAAWLIATGRAPTRKALTEARELAERAVAGTERMDPNFLDTLAEVQFQTGDVDEALGTIDEAIALAPGVAYFEEQRRRFTGERAAQDRPEPPEPFWVEPERPELAPDDELEERPGISI